LLLQEHQNEDLYEKAVSILETYFECEEGDDQNLAPQMAGNQYAFGQQAAQVRRLSGEALMVVLGPGRGRQPQQVPWGQLAVTSGVACANHIFILLPLLLCFLHE
jgi:hypothetical protein